MEENRKVPQIFLGGCPRSGTTLVVDLLGMHPALSPIYETNFVLQLSDLLARSNGVPLSMLGPVVMTIMDRWSRDLPFRPHEKKDYERYWHGPHHICFDRAFALRSARELSGNLWRMEPADALRRFLEALFGEHARRDGKPAWINKTPRYVLQLPFLKQVFPEMKFVHCVRDPREAVLSILSRRWGQHHGLQGAIRLWLQCIEKARAYAARWPQDFVETRVEDFLVQPEMETDRILRALGLSECGGEMVARYRERITFEPGRAAAAERDPGLVRDVEAMTVNCMAELGYR